ncbi:MAG TPA: hypothetical protein VKF62_03795, partial [Planctomycetota bacterium]|nr:hypothetical protein [Planctomycetota bacterium]
RFLLCPLPVELSDDPDSAEAVYREALRLAGIPPSPPRSRGLLGRRLRYPTADLRVWVNESAETQEVLADSVVPGTTISLPPGRAALLLVDRKGAGMLDAYAPSGPRR